MSVEKAKEFLIKTATEEEASAKADQAYWGSLLNVAKEMGYEFCAEDLRAAMEDLSSFGELSEAELEQVAGGGIKTILDSIVSFSTSPNSTLAQNAPSGLLGKLVSRKL